MYNRDMPLLRAHALSSPAGLVDVIAFVLSTIQQPLASCARQMADIRAHGAASVYLFGSKRAGYEYAVEHREVLFAAVVKAVEVGDVVGAVDVLANVPGLGVVKASFVAQIVGLEVACLDSHNLKRLGCPRPLSGSPRVSSRRPSAPRSRPTCRRAATPAVRSTGGTLGVACRRHRPRQQALGHRRRRVGFHVECVLAPAR
jgi:hypothetical protein